MYLDSVCPSGRPAFDFDRLCWTWAFNSAINCLLLKLSCSPFLSVFLSTDLDPERPVSPVPADPSLRRGAGFPRLGIFGLKVNSTQGKRIRDGEFNCFWWSCVVFSLPSCVVYSLFFWFIFLVLFFSPFRTSFSAVNRAVDTKAVLFSIPKSWRFDYIQIVSPLAFSM